MVMGPTPTPSRNRVNCWSRGLGGPLSASVLPVRDSRARRRGTSPRPRSTPRLGLLGIAVMPVVLLGACATSPGGGEPAPNLPVLSLDFDDVPKGISDGDEIPHGGADALSVVLLTRRASDDAPAAAAVVDGRDGGQALQLPALVPDAEVDGPTLQPLAVISVVPLSLASPHPLDPGDRPFSFGASFRLDKRSSGSAVDGGDNLMGRGSFDDPAQYKIQVDSRMPSCRIQGSAGTVLVKADREVEPERWYSMQCSRSDDGVQLSVTSYEDDEPEVRTWSEQGLTGDLGLLDPAVPLAVGGKLTPAAGLVRSETDGFNGAVDDVVLRVDE